MDIGRGAGRVLALQRKIYPLSARVLISNIAPELIKVCALRTKSAFFGCCLTVKRRKFSSKALKVMVSGMCALCGFDWEQ